MYDFRYTFYYFYVLFVLGVTAFFLCSWSYYFCDFRWLSNGQPNMPHLKIQTFNVKVKYG